MSRIGNKLILIPAGVTVEKNGVLVLINGPKGSLQQEIDPEIFVEIDGQNLVVKRKNDQKRVRALHGLVRNLIANNIVGVTKGWSKDLELVGVGFRAQVNGNKLVLNIGFSHPIEVEAKDGMSFEVTDNTNIKVSGIDKQLVGQLAANIRKIRPPDVYKGKGIRYSGEYIRKKVGKSAKVGATAIGAK